MEKSMRKWRADGQVGKAVAPLERGVRADGEGIQRRSPLATTSITAYARSSVQGGNMNGSDAPPAIMEGKISKPQVT